MEKGAHVKAHDPVAISSFRKLLDRYEEQVGYVETWQDEAASADIVIIATRWPDYQELAGMELKGKIVFDARRMFTPAMLGEATYLSIGRRMHQP